MYPMYDPALEYEWLYQIANWSRNQEKYIASLKEEAAASPEQAEQFDKWQKRFIQLRNIAENQGKASSQGVPSQRKVYSTPYLLQQSHQLHYYFSRFLQDQLLESGVKTMRHAEQNEHEYAYEDSAGIEEEGERGRETYMRPVPIGQHTLPPLPYPYDALEPYIDEKTMRLHHDKHHRSYVEGLNKAEKEMAKARRTGDFSLIKHWEREAAFNGAGHYLHTIFWNNMKPGGGGQPTGPIAREITRTFGSFQKFKQHFSHAADKVEGGGWAMLVWSPRSHRVEILQAEKHQNLSQQDMIPLLVLDVWEHAYYLKYNNERKKYISAWWNVVNWDSVNRRYEEARKVRWKPY